MHERNKKQKTRSVENAYGFVWILIRVSSITNDGQKFDFLKETARTSPHFA